MKQKIVINVDIHCDKCRKKALKIAAKQDGVISVGLEGAEKDKVVVIGDGVDAASLTLCLGKKLHHASIESVEVVKPKAPEPPKPNPPKPDPPKPQPICHICQSICCGTPNFCFSTYPPNPVSMYTVVPANSYGPDCIIM